jgi:hypothetical protein
MQGNMPKNKTGFKKVTVPEVLISKTNLTFKNLAADEDEGYNLETRLTRSKSTTLESRSAKILLPMKKKLKETYLLAERGLLRDLLRKGDI